ncbi:5-formyltetrahydrofolate cyclo-ligase [Nostocoides sp. HKS02]|uniref:5-formyltetrahydrofolate cyclo-ligase n=1 Tax=Nostocoides sp. HKS02 TaxID=1813880 RepID=UPI0018A83C9A|nr:5-formyltetrahydrofolate cyclo-ligase [Tetrasphaera sp. HKS02]
MTDQPAGSDAKALVRARLRSRRRAEVAGRDRAEDAESLALDGLRVAHEAGLARGSWVAAYESTPLEPPTEALIAALVARGIRVMVPITLPDWDLDWREVGIPDPLGSAAIGRAQVVFVPAHAVDGWGNRVGQGKGCYDRVLPRTSALVVAVVHPWEVLDEPLPHDAHDRPVDAVMAAGLGVRHLGAPAAG